MLEKIRLFCLLPLLSCLLFVVVVVAVDAVKPRAVDGADSRKQADGLLLFFSAGGACEEVVAAALSCLVMMLMVSSVILVAPVVRET